jgi:hypothetical protein
MSRLLLSVVNVFGKFSVLIMMGDKLSKEESW